MQKKNNINYSKRNQNNNLRKYNIKFKKKKIIKAIKKNKNLSHQIMILELINDNALDNHIILLNRKKTIVNNSPLIKKAYLTSEEQFANIIDNFITYFLHIFSNFDTLKIILTLCLNSDKHKVLLAKYYLYDNKYIDYYTYNYKLMIINNFYQNALKFQNALKYEFEQVNLNPKKINLQNSDELNKLITLLEELCFINKNRYSLLSLFTLVEDESYDFYLKEWEIIFSNYLNNIDFVHEYQKFKQKANRPL